MIVSWRPWLFALLLIGLVLSLEWGRGLLSAHEDFRIDLADAIPIDASISDDEAVITPPGLTSHVINVYDFGVIEIEAPEEVTEPVVDPEPTITLYEAAPPSPVSVEPAVGTWPALEADYDSIGFSRYASAVENVGRFYMLVRQGSELRLGPELSLDQRLIFRASSSDIEPSFDRPHLVVGPEVQSRLRSMPMPTDAIVDSVVLAFESSFDRRLWSRISLGLADFGLQISDVSQIRGAYIERNNNVILVLADAIVRVDGRVVTINDQIGIY